MEYELEYIDEFNVDLNSTIQSVVDWYETDEVHPIKNIPVEIRDVFWASFEYIIGKEEFEKSFSTQITQFYHPGEKPNLSINRIDFKAYSIQHSQNQNRLQAIQEFIKSNKVFNREDLDDDLLFIEGHLNYFTDKIIDLYSKGDLNQEAFSMYCENLMQEIDAEYELLDSEDSDDLHEYLFEFSNLFGLNYPTT